MLLSFDAKNEWKISLFRILFDVFFLSFVNNIPQSTVNEN